MHEKEVILRAVIYCFFDGFVGTNKRFCGGGFGVGDITEWIPRRGSGSHLRLRCLVVLVLLLNHIFDFFYFSGFSLFQR